MAMGLLVYTHPSNDKKLR